MIEKLSILAIFLVQSCLGEQIAIAHKPSYVSFADTTDSIPVSEIQHILAAIHGFSLHKELSFHGLYALPPFQHPKASAIVTLYGGDNYVSQMKTPKFSLKTDELYVPAHGLKHHLEQFYGQDSNVIELDHDSKVNDFSGVLEGMSDSVGSVFYTVNGVFRLQLLNTTKPEIFQFLRQCSLLLQSLDKVSTAGAGVGDFYSFELYMPTSESAAVNVEISDLVKAILDKVNTQLSKMYGEDYVVFVLSLPEASIIKSRKTRSLMATEDGDTDLSAKRNLATAYSADYPVIFHIVLWLVVFMFLIVLFTIYGMMSMDPGNDSIIYRMTATKVKKDN